jgi:hypothetical protein
VTLNVAVLLSERKKGKAEERKGGREGERKR